MMIEDTARVEFKPLAIDYVEDLFRVWSDDDVMEHMVLEPFKSMEEAVGMITMLSDLISRGEAGRWTMVEKASGKVMGTLGFHNVHKEHRRAEIGYEMSKEFWGKGFMREALGALLEHCFLDEDVNRLEAFVNHGNEKSRQLLLRLGFTEEGVLRDYEFARGRFMSQMVFSLLRREWLEAGK
jgi:ribosomal-protein-alanine N-acetyltransferase